MVDWKNNIPELANLGAGRGLIRIPMEQDVPFTSRVRAIVDSAEFQRLAHISQLGLTVKVYPGATHTRFEHALGVFSNALQYLSQLAQDERFCATVDEHTAETLIVAALLHDLGHWPFCHPIEDMDLPNIPAHEAFALRFLGDNNELTTVLREQWNVEPHEVLEVLSGTSEAPEFRMIRSILSGPIDIDKMDYLDRDSLHAGVPYGRNFDRSRLIQSLLVNEAGDGLAINVKGKTAAELMVFARYVMFSEVYWHHAVRSATCMFARSFYELNSKIDIDNWLCQFEPECVSILRDAATGTEWSELVEGVFGVKRQLHKQVAELSLYQHADLYSELRGQPYGKVVECSRDLAKRISADMNIATNPGDILIDAPPAHREVEFRVQIYFPKEDVYRTLAEVSPVVEALAKTQFDDHVKRVRVFASRDVAKQIREKAGFEECLKRSVRSCV